MRLRVLAVVVALLCFCASALAWDKDDHEIFELVSGLEASEGKGTTFYSFLNLTKSATTAEINRASRKRSLELHPDKNPGVKDAPERFARLGVIVSILRDPAKRKRYNFFHDNGVPRWKGTGYMYSRWQPGLPFALSIILIFSTLCQYLVQHATYRSELLRISRFQRAARFAAHGPRSSSSSSIIPSEERKKVRVPLNAGKVDVDDAEEDEEGAGTGSRAARRAAAGKGKANKQAAAAQGQLVTMIVQGEKVWIQAEDGSELPLDTSAANRPSLLNTFIPNLVRRLLARASPAKASAKGSSEAATDGDAAEGDDATLTDSSVAAEPKAAAGPAAGTRKRKAGGKGKR